MKNIIVIIFATVAAIWALTVTWQMRASAAGDVKGAIQQLENDLKAGVEAKDVDKIMANYTNSEKLVVFDLIPPRQYTGWDAYKANWKGFLDSCKDNPKLEISDLHSVGGAGFAFSHSIQHFSCTDTKGNKVDLTLRVTDAYEHFKTGWLIAHEHISVPVDVATGKADLESKP